MRPQRIVVPGAEVPDLDSYTQEKQAEERGWCPAAVKR